MRRAQRGSDENKSLNKTPHSSGEIENIFFEIVGELP